ncbi:hypothetical protein J2741_000257 [Methanolinea mesophila]|uniref:hypothetical protein n=1 Tax=Methanolinea mesophila TaxID=547055 RepID=UPI001AE8CF4A|nr:hypothetical protein [Methanolinea mesophila]MBP1927710.1 hypothetical protein [Methanolinea mesophila]
MKISEVILRHPTQGYLSGLFFIVLDCIFLFIEFVVPLIVYINALYTSYAHPWDEKNSNIPQNCLESKYSHFIHYIKIKIPYLYRRRDYIRYLLLPILIDCIFGYHLAVTKREYIQGREHDGIVIVHENIAKMSFYGDGVGILIKFFYEQEPPIPYKVYHCDTLQKFIEVVRNPDVTSLWIFGHGQHSGIGCGVNHLIYELTFPPPPKTPEKKYIYQLHCNSGCGISLTDILSHQRGFANYRNSDPYINQFYVKQIIKNF